MVKCDVQMKIAVYVIIYSLIVLTWYIMLFCIDAVLGIMERWWMVLYYSCNVWLCGEVGLAGAKVLRRNLVVGYRRLSYVSEKITSILYGLTNRLIWKKYTEEIKDIKFRLREWNILHFNQAHTTPLATPAWEKRLTPDELLTKEMKSIIIDAINDSEDIHQDSRCILEEILKNIRDPMPEEKNTISLEEFLSFYKCTKEDIFSSPSGLHLGHYKAAAYSNDFSTILWSIASLALDNQYCLQRWQHSATILLEKFPENPWFTDLEQFTW